jgi:predicted RecA/RadA family phage recombinase
MTNYVQSGNVLLYPNTGALITSGSVVIAGKFIGIAATDIAATTGTGAVNLCGVYKLAKTNPLVITQGDNLYWNTGTGKVTKAATDTYIGTAWLSAASTDTIVQVKLPGGEGMGTQGQIVFQAQNATATAVDLPTAEALANALQTDFNALLTKLKNSGLMAAS